jgi:hypothetical protein
VHYVILPLDDGRISARAELSGTDYVLEFYWNARQAAWLMSVLTADNVPLVSGITCTSNRYLLQRYRYIEELPPGELLFVDPTGQIDQADLTQFGREAQLLYVEPEEIV